MTPDDEKLFMLPKNTQLYNARQLNKAEAIIEEALEEVAEADKKAEAKKKKPKKDKKGEVIEDEEPKGPPGETPLNKQLRELVRTERFEHRMEHLSEVSMIQSHLNNHQVPITGHTLEKAILFPEDEYMPKEFREKPYPDVQSMLLVNPFPKPKKGKKKKKK